MQIQEFGGFCLVKDQMSNEKELFRLMLLYTAPGGGVHNNLYEFPWRFLLQERPIAKQDFPSWAIKRKTHGQPPTQPSTAYDKNRETRQGVKQ